MGLSISFHYPVFIFFGYTLRSEISGLHGKYFFLILGGITILVSIVTELIYIPTKYTSIPLRLDSHEQLYFLLSWCRHYKMCEGQPHSGFASYFPDASDV